MIIEIDGGKDIDTDRHLTAAERHVVQKLFGWKSMVTSVAEFRDKKESALRIGWGDSGPIPESNALKNISMQLERDLKKRLSKNS